MPTELSESNDDSHTGAAPPNWKEAWRIAVAVVVVTVGLSILYLVNAPALPIPAPAPTAVAPVATSDPPGVYAADKDAILRRMGKRSLTPFEMDVSGIDEPLLIPAGDAQLPDETTVAGIEIDGQARAYKLEQFAAYKDEECYRHIVKDAVGGRVYWVTHCNLTRETRVVTTKQGFDPPRQVRVGGYNQGLLLLVDERRFNQMDPNISALADVPHTICSWKEWRDKHPETLVYDGRTREEPVVESTEPISN